MRKPQTFFELQLMQRQHDERNHTDICPLPMFDRMNHYVLHYAKYAARLTKKLTEKQVLSELIRTYTDSFLISLSASNAMNIDLDKEMKIRFNLTLDNLTDKIKNIQEINLDKLRIYSRDILVISNGAMADTMEKRDHLDDVNSREILINNLLEIIKMIIIGSKHISFDIVKATLDRRSQIASLKIT